MNGLEDKQWAQKPLKSYVISKDLLGTRVALLF